MAGRTSRGSDKFMLRLPDGMRDRIKADALANDRSMTAEIVARLSGTQANLRDQFAMHAMGALIERSLASSMNGKNDPIDMIRQTAITAYQVADAMLAARGEAS